MLVLFMLLSILPVYPPSPPGPCCAHTSAGIRNTDPAKTARKQANKREPFIEYLPGPESRTGKRADNLDTPGYGGSSVCGLLVCRTSALASIIAPHFSLVPSSQTFVERTSTKTLA